MRDAVRKVFTPFQTTYEGAVPCMYLDDKGLVTTAIGLLIDSPGAARRLPWEVDGRTATPNEINAEWAVVKQNTGLAVAGWKAAMAVTRLRLSPENVNLVTLEKAADMEVTLRKRFTNYDDLCGDAQLGVWSLTWSCGEDFAFPKFQRALALEDFARYDTDTGELLAGTCAFECIENATGNPGLIPRNAATRKLFEAAQRVVDAGGDPDTITGWGAP